MPHLLPINPCDASIELLEINSHRTTRSRYGRGPRPHRLRPHLLQDPRNRVLLIINPHRKDPRQLAKQARKLFLGDIPRPVGIERRPRLLKAARLLAVDNLVSAGALVHVREALVDERHEQRDEDVHAQDVPGDEERVRPRRAAAVAVEEGRPLHAQWGARVRVVLHDLVPALAHGHAEEHDERAWHVAEVEVVGALAAEAREPKCLSHGDGVDEEQDEPCGEEVADAG
ncbi:hypothetical protein V494_04419 [Pseudogymnoascus sp. VKM F-4513 (FW-928)]|nr:hypothetical protein V494_04419 [Pseudogymnoascus sp. VKM F-4513 (FW-928)]